MEIQPTAFEIPLSTKLQNTERQETSEVANALIVPLNDKFKTTSLLEDAEDETPGTICEPSAFVGSALVLFVRRFRACVRVVRIQHMLCKVPEDS